MKEFTITGEQIYNFIIRDFKKEHLTFFLSCYIEDDEDDPLNFAILGLDKQLIQLKDDNEKKIKKPIKWLNSEDRNLKIPSYLKKFNDLILGARTKEEVHIEAFESTFIKFEVSLSKFNRSDKIFCGNIINNFYKNKITPNEDERKNFYELIKQSEHWHFGAALYKEWLKIIENRESPRYDGVGRLHLAVMYRSSGLYCKALKVTEIIEFPSDQFKCNQGTRAVLCTNRAAALMDELGFLSLEDKKLQFKKILRYLKWAYAINQKSLFLFKAYQRYNKLEKEYFEEKGIINRITEFNDLGDLE